MTEDVPRCDTQPTPRQESGAFASWAQDPVRCPMTVTCPRHGGTPSLTFMFPRRLVLSTTRSFLTRSLCGRRHRTRTSQSEGWQAIDGQATRGYGIGRSLGNGVTGVLPGCAPWEGPAGRPLLCLGGQNRLLSRTGRAQRARVPLRRRDKDRDEVAGPSRGPCAHPGNPAPRGSPQNHSPPSFAFLPQNDGVSSPSVCRRHHGPATPAHACAGRRRVSRPGGDAWRPGLCAAPPECNRPVRTSSARASRARVSVCLVGF